MEDWCAHGTAVGEDAPVLVSFVLRLVPRELHAGRLVGVVVSVQDGSEESIGSADELLAFARDHLSGDDRAAPDGDRHDGSRGGTQ